MPYDPMNQTHPGPLEGIDRIPADTTQARTGNTEREQEAWFAGVEEGQRRTEHNAAVRTSADGWKLVPIEPTPKMIKAWHDTYSKAVIKTGRSNRAYAAMLAAAPSPAAVAPGDAQKVYHFEQRSRFGPWIEVEKPTAKSVEFVKRSGAPAAGDTPPRFTISASDRFELTGAVGLLRGYDCAGAADALQRVLDAESASFSVQGEDDARDAGRYRTVRKVAADKENGYALMAEASREVGIEVSQYPTPEQFDAVVDLVAAQQGKGGEA